MAADTEAAEAAADLAEEASAADLAAEALEAPVADSADLTDPVVGDTDPLQDVAGVGVGAGVPEATAMAVDALVDL